MFEINRAGLEGGNHSHVPRKPHPAGSGRGERREALTNSLISAQQTVPSPRCHSHRLQDVSTGELHGFFLLRGSQRRKRGQGEDTAQPRMLLCWLLPDGFPKLPTGCCCALSARHNFPCTLMRNTAVLPICLARSWQYFEVGNPIVHITGLFTPLLNLSSLEEMNSMYKHAALYINSPQAHGQQALSIALHVYVHRICVCVGKGQLFACLL